MFFWTKPQRRDFSYVADRIVKAAFASDPFRHVYIDQLFKPDDFRAITGAPEIRLKRARSDEELLELLHQRHFKEIEFPGTTTNLAAYLAGRRDREGAALLNKETCEGFGVVMRLRETHQTPALAQLVDFLKSDLFANALHDKFSLGKDEHSIDVGIQKYLDGYEISPHPDIRKKSLTFMVNINPSSESERLDYHTHYMAFRPERAQVKQFWESNSEIERCWVPWAWGDTHKRQTQNNSMVIFAPDNDTLHAVKASYDHLTTQRTQIYGNLWKQNPPPTRNITWTELEALLS
ncbi:MAG: hypothetical protein P4L68_06725 [Methylovirgula sp.]|nr:hypothetical protein [Methylovirgula sp.]